MSALTRGTAARAAGAGAAVRAGRARQQPLDGQCDLAIRCHLNDLHLHSIAVVQDGVDVLHIFIGHFGNVDHAYPALRQRNKCAERLHAGHTAFKYVPYLNRQNSILLALFLGGCSGAGRRPSRRTRPQLPVTSTKMRSLGAA